MKDARKLDNSAITRWAINSLPAMIQIRQIDVVGRVATVEQGWFKASSPLPTTLLRPPQSRGDMTKDGRKRFRDRRAAARVNNATTSFREARRRWTGTRVHARASMREVLIGSVRGWGAQKQPSGQTSQHQSAPVTRARTIGANIAILPAFTFDGEKDNDRTGGVVALSSGIPSCPGSWKRSGPITGSYPVIHRDLPDYARMM